MVGMKIEVRYDQWTYLSEFVNEVKKSFGMKHCFVVRTAVNVVMIVSDTAELRLMLREFAKQRLEDASCTVIND